VETSPYTIGPFTPQLNEVHSTELRVVGEIPRELDGAYMRTGPNPQHEPHGGYVMCAFTLVDSSLVVL
jgi:carotenoid cleavage dioxygenase